MPRAIYRPLPIYTISAAPCLGLPGGVPTSRAPAELSGVMLYSGWVLVGLLWKCPQANHDGLKQQKDFAALLEVIGVFGGFFLQW